ncbi:Protein lunapark [Acipenser ruthenus]|uniref:Endoplasmic reticulum junction formation protein lunapark n=1 Tax=Acipenser ruthenus TaxID=7906 RepID=A0A444U6W0_ACIRT|nr:Protein lunapark [Acipenser ruthenus]
MMERIRKEMILMERGLHSPAAGKRLSNLSDSAGNAVLEALENSQHSGRLSPRLTSASLHNNVGNVPAKSKFEIDSLFNIHHQNSDNNSSSEISSSENRKKITLYPEVHETDMDSDVEVGCSSHRSPNSLSAAQHKENNNKGEKLEELKAQKKKILEEVMEKETYKTAKLILERFDPDSKKKNEQELAAVAGPPVTPRPGQELRQRNVSQKNPVPATPINPNQGVPHPPATPSAPSPTSAPGGPPERTLAMAAAQQNLMRRSMSPGTPVPGMGLHPPGPPLARAILPRERGVMDRVVEFLVGDGPQNRYALVCQQCFSHNGMALKEEFEYVAFRCAYCYFLNPARKTRPQAPRLPDFSFERRPCTDSQTSGVSAETGVSENQPSAVPLEEARQEGKPVDTDTAERDAQASDEKQTPQVEEQKPLENAEAEQEEVSFMKTE